MSCDWCETKNVHLNRRGDPSVCDQCADEVDEEGSEYDCKKEKPE